MGGASIEMQKGLREYGMALGTAYQIYDDCLDLFGTEQIAGKSLGTDVANGKYTLPVLVAIERASKKDLDKIKSLLCPMGPPGST